MKLTSEKLKSLYQEATARSATGRAKCLSTEVMTRAATAELGQAEIEGVIDHLATCSDCAGEFRVVCALKSWAEEVSKAVAGPLEPASPPSATPKRSPFRASDKAVTERPTLWQKFVAALSPALAAFVVAALLLTLLALGGWLASIRHENHNHIARLQEQLAERDRALGSTKKSLEEALRQIEETSRRTGQDNPDASRQDKVEIARLRRTISEISKPQLEIPIVDLNPGGATREGLKEGTPMIETPEARNGPKRTIPRWLKEEITMIEAPGTANLVTLILNFDDQKRYSNLEVVIFDQSGKEIWRRRSALQSQIQSLNVTLSRHFLPGGRGLIKLFGLREAKKELIANYPVAIRNKS